MNIRCQMDEFYGVFFICLQGMSFRYQMDEYYGMFFICLQGINFQWRTDEFWGGFLIYLQGMNFWWRLDGCNVWYICGTRNALCLDQPGSEMCSMYCLQMSQFAPLHFNILSIASLKVGSSIWERKNIGEARGDHDVNGVEVNLCKVFWYQKGFVFGSAWFQNVFNVLPSIVLICSSPL